MTNVEDIRNHSSQWVFIAPLAGVELTKAVNNEFKISRVSLIAKRKLARVRKRYGLDITKNEFDERIIGSHSWTGPKADTYAIIRCSGKPKELQRECISIVKDELHILASSQLGYGKRRTNSHPSLMGYQNKGQISYLFHDSKSERGIYSNQLIGKYMPLSMSYGWKRHHKESFFIELLRLINGNSVKRGWRKTLRRAAIMIGQSQCSNDLVQSFIWNMIVLEMLLKKEGDKYIDVLPERIEAFIGWIGYWSVGNYEKWIQEVYKKRCKFVHNGQWENIGVLDLLFTDDILLNLLVNIVRHPRIFHSKDAVIEFADKVKAEHVLGIKPRVRPKSMVFFSRRYSENDLSEI